MGNNARTMGGYAGLAQGLAFATELQGDSTPHGHGFMALANAYQHSTLEEIAEKISLGKINKFKEDNSLLTQDWVMDPKLKVKDVLAKVDSKNLNIKDFIRIKIGE